MTPADWWQLGTHAYAFVAGAVFLLYVALEWHEQKPLFPAFVWALLCGACWGVLLPALIVVFGTISVGSGFLEAWCHVTKGPKTNE